MTDVNPLHSLAEAAVQKIPANPVASRLIAKRGPAGAPGTTPPTGQRMAEMRRVVRSGGAVAAAVWDHLGGMPAMRMMVDTVAALSEGGRRL